MELIFVRKEETDQVVISAKKKKQGQLRGRSEGHEMTGRGRVKVRKVKLKQVTQQYEVRDKALEQDHARSWNSKDRISLRGRVLLTQKYRCRAEGHMI